MNCSVIHEYTRCHTCIAKTRAYIISSQIEDCLLMLHYIWSRRPFIFFNRLFIDLCHLHIKIAHSFSSRFVLLNHLVSLLCNATRKKTTKQRIGNGIRVILRTVSEDCIKRKLLVQNFDKRFKPMAFHGNIKQAL